MTQTIKLSKMYFTVATAIAVLAATSVFAVPADPNHGNDNDDKNPNLNIFPNPVNYEKWAICKGQITTKRFRNLQAPTPDGGCVRYYQGIDMTGIVTEIHLLARDGIKSACDCIAACLNRPATCTNWVFKHAFVDGDEGKRTCTLYSSPNLPTGVTLVYDTARSSGFKPLPQGNKQAGALVPLTTLDGKMPDRFGVSGFMVQDENHRQWC